MDYLKLGHRIIRLSSIDEMRVSEDGQAIALYLRGQQCTYRGAEAAALIDFFSPGPTTRRRLGRTIDITPGPDDGSDIARAALDIERERDTYRAALEAIVAFTPTWPNPTGVGPEEQILAFVKTTVARAMAACAAPATAE